MSAEKGPTELVFSPKIGQEIQSYLWRRLQESKTQPTAKAIEQGMADLCGEVMSYLQGWVLVGKRAAFGEGCVLYWIEKYWPELEPLHAQYDSFNDFAVQETREEYTTYHAKMGIYKTFILNESGDPRVAEEGTDVFLDIPLGKLQKARGAVRRGEMTENQWDALLDTNVNDRQFHHVMKAKTLGDGSEEDDFVYEGGDPRTTVNMDDGSVVYWPGASQMGLKIGWLDVASTDDTVREAVDAIIGAAGLKRLS